jgi:hypothetical protein
MRRVVVILCVLLLLLAMGLVAAPDAKAGADTVLDTSVERGYWQYSVGTEENVVKLGIRDKGGQVGAYRATFVVIGPDKREYSSAKNGAGTAEVTASFPRDFGAEWTRGVYTWNCTIGGRMILQGSFEYCASCQIRLFQAGFVPLRSAGR